jgi:hypothetical protein
MSRRESAVAEPVLPDVPEEGILELSWELFGELCRALALRVAHEYDPEVVVGIAAAGVIPGAVIAAMLQREFYAIKITRWDEEGGSRSRPQILSARSSTRAATSRTTTPWRRRGRWSFLGTGKCWMKRAGGWSPTRTMMTCCNGRWGGREVGALVDQSINRSKDPRM